MTTRSVDNFNNIENYGDVVDVLIAENAINNVPNGINTGQYAIWDNTSNSYTLSGFPSVRLGSFAGNFGQDNNAIAIGTNSARHEQGTLAISLGWNCGRTHQGSSAIAIGSQAGSLTQGQNAISIGELAGQVNQQFESISLGKCAGQVSQGTLSIAIGSYAGQSSQVSNSIVLNATGNPLNPSFSSIFIDPVRNTTTGSNVICYDTTSKELSYVSNINPINVNATTITGTNITASNLTTNNQIIVPLGSLTNCAVQFSGDPNTGLYSSGADVLNLVTGGGNRLTINSGGLTISGSIFLGNGSVSSPPIRFSNSTTTGIYSTGTDNFSVATSGVQRLSISTSAIICSLPIQLQTTGGTASNLDYYEQATITSAYNYGNQTNIQSSTITLTRIGRLVNVHVPDWSGSATNTNGSAATIDLIQTIPTRFRPLGNINPVCTINVASAYKFVRLSILTDGTFKFTQENATGFPNNTLVQVFANSFTYPVL